MCLWGRGRGVFFLCVCVGGGGEACTGTLFLPVWHVPPYDGTWVGPTPLLLLCWASACTCAQVARTLVQGLRAGAYHLPGPEFTHNIVLNHFHAVSPKPIPLLAALFVTPIFQLVSSFLTVRADRVTRRWWKDHSPLGAEGGQGAGESEK